MIAQVVFDLPLEGPFDYSVPEHLAASLAVGTRVKVSFGPRPQTGFVIGLLAQSAIPNIKPVQSVIDASPVFNDLDLGFAGEFSAYYGCSLGESLATILRNKKDLTPSVRRTRQPSLSLYQCPPDLYAAKIKEVSKGKDRVFILVPDSFRAQMLFKSFPSVAIGARSSVFECDGRYETVIMVDEEDASYKQEQTPMYEARQVLMNRCRIFGFDVVFVGFTPSVELMKLVLEGKVKSLADPANLPPAKVIDLTNYKFLPGMISPPVRDGLEAAFKSGKKSLLVLNRKGSYRLTRCVDCGEILKCGRCDSPLMYSRSAGKFLCRHCTYHLPGDTACPKCHKPSWRSVGIGVEQLQSELKKQFPSAKIAAYARDRKQQNQVLSDFDILISTQAVLRFQGTMKVQFAAFIDFDAELNRLDMRSAFHAFRLALHVTAMCAQPVFLQTRNSGHYVLEALLSGKAKGFYDQELKLRKEFGFSPYKHWIKIGLRGKSEKFTLDAATHVYNDLNRFAPEGISLTPPLPDTVGRKRELFRFNVMVQADQVDPAVAFIKSQLGLRRSRVIVTMNVDP